MQVRKQNRVGNIHLGAEIVMTHKATRINLITLREEVRWEFLKRQKQSLTNSNI